MQFRKYTSVVFLGTLLFSALVIIQACRKDIAPPPPAPNYSWVEDFDTLANALQRGWGVVNNSRPLGTQSWIQGQYFIDDKGKLNGYSASSYSYSGQDFVLCTFNANGDEGSISAWLIAPETTMKNGDTIKFYTRTLENPATYADRMQVRLNPNSASTNVGWGPLTDTAVGSMVGDFTRLLVDINPTLALSGPSSFPGAWRQYTVVLSGLPAPVKRRFAFRYFIPTMAGPSGANGQGVSIDKVEFISK